MTPHLRNVASNPNLILQNICEGQELLVLAPVDCNEPLGTALAQSIEHMHVNNTMSGGGKMVWPAATVDWESLDL